MPASYISPRFQAVDDVGRPIVGGRLYTYISKTTIPKATYQDADGNASNTNPVVLDADGAAMVYLVENELYRFVLLDPNGVLLWSADDIRGQIGLGTLDAAVDSARDSASEAAEYANLQVYETEAAMRDAQPQAAGIRARVWGDPDISKRGYYDSDGTIFIWVEPQPASASDVLAAAIQAEAARDTAYDASEVATQAAVQAAQSKDGADVARDAAEHAAADARAAADASGERMLFDTYADAQDALGSIPDLMPVEVLVDENVGGAHTLYRKESGDLVFKLNLDYLEQKLAQPGGGDLVAFQQQGAGAVPQTLQSKSEQILTTDDYVDTQSGFNAAVLLNSTIYSPRDLTITISEDTPLQAVVDHFAPLGRKQRIRLHIESGHVLTSGLYVAYGDYSQFYITSDDPVVHLGGAGWAGQSVLRGRYAIMPSLACLIDCEELPLYGLHADAGSCCFIEEGCGMIRAGAGSGSGVEGANLFVARGSRVMAEFTQFHSSVYRNLWISQNSLAFFRGIEAYGAVNQGLFLSRGSVVHADHANLSGCAVGVRNARSWASLRQSDLSNSSVQAINCFETGVVTARFAQLTGSAAGIYLFQGGGMVEISGGNCDNITGHVLETVNGVGTVSMNSASAQGIGGKLATVTGCYDIDLSSVNASGGTGATIRQGCTASMVNTQLVGSGVSGSVGLSCEDGGRAVRVSGRVSGWGQDLRVIRGSSINANGCTTTNGTPALADTNVSAFNVQSPGGGGIIYN